MQVRVFTRAPTRGRADVGGGYYRFLLPAYLFLVLPAVGGVEELFDALAPRRLFPVLLTVFLTLWTAAGFAVTGATRVRHPRELLTPASSGWLRDNVPPCTWTASGAMGRLAYFSDLPFIDYYGLCDVEVALHGARTAEFRPGHEVGDAEEVFRRRPGLIVIRPLPGTREQVEGWVAGRLATTDLTWTELAFAQKLVFSDPRMADYQALVVDVTDRIEGKPPGGESYYLGFYARRGELADLLVSRGAVPVEPAVPEGFCDPRGG